MKENEASKQFIYRQTDRVAQRHRDRYAFGVTVIVIGN